MRTMPDSSRALLEDNARLDVRIGELDGDAIRDVVRA